MRKTIFTIVLIVATFAVWGRFSPIPKAMAGVIVVDDMFDDTIDDDYCSLREAITNANDNAQTYDDCAPGIVGETDIILIDLPSYETIYLDDDLPVITDHLVIESVNPSVFISGDDWYRLFYVPFGVSLELRYLKLESGYTDDGVGGLLYVEGTVNLHAVDFGITDLTYAPVDSEGSAVYVSPLGILNGQYTLFSENFAERGGALYNAGITSLNLCNFNYNEAKYGGAIYNTGDLTLDECIIDSNGYGYDYIDAEYGGGIYNAGSLTLTEVYFVDNGSYWTTYGGALYHEGLTTGFTIDQSLFEDNTAYMGGAIYVDNSSCAGSCDAYITNTFFKENYTNGDGGTIYKQGDSLSIWNSSFGDGYSFMGHHEIVNDGGFLGLVNVTLKGDYNRPSIAALGGNLELIHTTLYEEETDTEGGLYISSTATADIYNSILYTDKDCTIETGGTVNSYGANFSADTTCNFGVGGDNIDPKFDFSDEYEYNGGWFETLALLPTSPAIDAATGANVADIFDLDNDGDTAEELPVDIRGVGFLRQIGAARDSGAFEYNPNPVDFVVDRTDDSFAGACTPAPDDCSLRGAVEKASYIDGRNTITFDDTIFSTPQTIVQDTFSPIYEYRGYSGYLIDTDMDIFGPGSDLLTISQDTLDPFYEYGSCGCADHSIFLISDQGGGLASLSDARTPMFGGNAQGHHGRAERTSGRADRSKLLRGTNYEYVTDVNITDMRIENGFDLWGGAIEIIVVEPFNNLTSREPGFPGVRLENIVFAHNSATMGGAINSISAIPVSVVGSTFEGNLVYSGGLFGGIFGGLTNKWMEKPAAGFPLLFFSNGGAIAHTGVQLNVYDSLFNGNYTGDGGFGGAIAIGSFYGFIPFLTEGRDGPNIPIEGVVIANTTFANNHSYGAPTIPPGIPFPVIQSAGGAIFSYWDIYAVNVTFADNDAEFGSSVAIVGDYAFDTLEGGRVPNDISYFTNVIFADQSFGPNCVYDGQILIFESTLSDDDSCDGYEYGNAEIGLDPAGLQDNGGRTYTIALVEGSFAVDSGTYQPGLIPDIFDQDGDSDYIEDVPYDQRGFDINVDTSRIQGDRIDIGAYETPFSEPKSDLTGAIIFDDPAMLADPIPGGIDVTEGAIIGDLICAVLDPEPDDDVTVYVTVDEGWLSALRLIDLSSPTTPRSFVQLDLDVSEIDTTICNPGQIIGVQALNATFDDFGPDTYSDLIQFVDIDSLTIDKADVTIYDPGLIITSPAHDPVGEGASTTYTIGLAGPPGIRNNAANAYETVTIEPRGFNNRFISVSPTSAVFTRANWDTPQVITVLAIDDAVNRGSRYNTSIMHQSSSNVTAPQNTMYGGAAPNLDPMSYRVRITIADNDLIAGAPMTQEEYDALNLAAWLDLAPTHAVALEGSAGALVLNVRIAGQPIDEHQVVLDLSSIAGVTVTPSQLVFTAQNWDIYQPIVISLPPNGSADGAYTVPLQVVVNAAMTTALDFVGAADAVQVGVADDPALIMPIVTVPELPASSFAPAPEPAGSSNDEGTASE